MSKVVIRCADGAEARKLAEKKLRGPVHISCVFKVKEDESVRDWVFSKQLVLQ